MNRLQRLSREFGQSPWLDNLQRSDLESGRLAQLRDRGVRGLTSNPTIFQRSITASNDYDAQFHTLLDEGCDPIESYWRLVASDIDAACDVFAPVHRESSGADGHVSVEVDPGLAHDTTATADAAFALHRTIGRDNLMVKIPATLEGLDAIQAVIAAGESVNVTLIFGLDRYRAVVESYLAGLEDLAVDPDADLSAVAGVASFFVSRVDTEVDQRLEQIGTNRALALRGTAALTQARLAYRIFGEQFSGPRWQRLAARGARPQRLLWASTGTKNPSYSDVLYVDGLIGPQTVNTLPESTLEAFDDHGTLDRTLEVASDRLDEQWTTLAEVGIDMSDVAETLESEGVAAFRASFDSLLETLQDKARLRG